MFLSVFPIVFHSFPIENPSFPMFSIYISPPRRPPRCRPSCHPGRWAYRGDHKAPPPEIFDPCKRQRRHRKNDEEAITKTAIFVMGKSWVNQRTKSMAKTSITLSLPCEHRKSELENGHRNWFTHQEWWFSIVMLVYQRVLEVVSELLFFIQIKYHGKLVMEL